MPRKPTQAQCKVLAGSPLILAASDEQRIREEWRKRERVYKAAMRRYREWCKDFAHTDAEAAKYKNGSPASNALIRACAAAKGKR